MKTALCTAVALAACSAPAAGQLVFELPSDAREVLEFHFEQDPGESSWDVLSSRFLAYFQSGARSEARAAVDTLLATDPGNPDGWRFQIWLDSREPELQAGALSAAGDWLARHRGGALPEDRVAEVERLSTALERELARREQVSRAGQRSRLAPLAAVALLALLFWHGRRTLLRA